MSFRRVALKIAFVFVGVIVVIASIGAMLPAEVQVSRSILIDKPAGEVFDYINNLHNWEKWSSWHSRDPSLKFQYNDTLKGTGASYTWNGSKVGEGVLIIKESKLNKHIATTVKTHGRTFARGEWQFEDSTGITKVTRTMTLDAQKNVFVRVFFNWVIPGVLSNDFDRGLQQLKKLTEEQKDSGQLIPVDSTMQKNDSLTSLTNN